MLTRTFVHVPGIGRRTERQLWKQGCRDWNDWLAEPQRYAIGSASRPIALQTIQASARAFREGHYQFFARSLRQTETWRAWSDFRESCVYLDIETDGRSSGDCVTVIGLYDGKTFEALVAGEGLESFRDRISHYSMIVTFFGSGFDLPFLERRFKMRFDQIHLDLCPTLKAMGFRGGLKKIEKQLGITRADGLEGLTGYDAVQLWQKHLRGSDSALETLIAYNREDVVNLERLAEHTYGEMRRATFGDQLSLF